MDIFKAILLGFFQGLTEFIPISSTGHLRIVPAVLGWEDPGAAFTAAIQLGTILAVLIYFSKDLIRIFVGWIRSLLNPKHRNTQESRLGWAIFWGTLPIGILGVLFKDIIETSFRSLYIVAFSLIGLALFLSLAEWMAKKTRTLEEVTPWAGVWVGLWQALALIPGMSRSGSTITGALFLGFDRATAARFSFILSVPAITAAGVYSIKSHADVLLGEALIPLLVANAVSFVTGYIAIAFLLRYLQKHSTSFFIFYRIGLGVLILILLQKGILVP